MIPLSNGAITRILRGDHVDKPIVQILKINKLDCAKNVYRLEISDGQVFSELGFYRMENENLINKINAYDIIEITSYKVIESTEKMISLDEITIKDKKVTCTIGNPKNYDSSGNNASLSAPLPVVKVAPPPPPPVVTFADALTYQHKNFNAKDKNYLNSSASLKPLALQNNRLRSLINAGIPIPTTPISKIDKEHLKWCIKGRIETINNVNSKDLKLIEVIIADKSKEIRCVIFRNLINQFRDTFEILKTYYIMGAKSVEPKHKYHRTSHKYELILDCQTEVELCNDAIIPLVSNTYIPIKDIKNKEDGSLVDILAVVVSNDCLKKIKFASGQSHDIIDLHLIDKSRTKIVLTLWDDKAKAFPQNDHPVVSAKRALVRTYQNTKKISTEPSSGYELNPNIPAAHDLHIWFTSIDAENVEISNAECLTIEQGIDKCMKNSVITFTCKARIISLIADDIIYQACPKDNCHKKVQKIDNVYRCPKCHNESLNYEPRLLIHMEIIDLSKSMEVTIFHDCAVKMIGQSAKELEDLQLSNNEEFNNIFEKLKFKEMSFDIRMEKKKPDDTLIVATITDVVPINYKA